MPDAAVVLMAYGSPDRLADVPAYYADIRGGRPIRPELLDDPVERYPRLGIEDGSPLNAIPQAARAAPQRELGGHTPPFSGIKPRTPRIHGALAPGQDPGRGRPVQGPAPRDVEPRRRAGRPRGERLELLLPERVPDGGAVARPGHPRPSGRPPRARSPRRPRLPGRLRRRPPRDPLGSRHGGRRARARARDALRADRDAERRA